MLHILRNIDIVLWGIMRSNPVQVLGFTWHAYCMRTGLEEGYYVHCRNGLKDTKSFSFSEKKKESEKWRIGQTQDTMPDATTCR
ncbi:unnamed protein product [Dovyalis caffra]|uniref:Uncharacterized protein n=1 Tax=Dovyalis caffra TaxID=77055 RepID=A0AAV1SUS4_9ROSI|nr:unnamed protein product [Dovyalis caffra]